MESFATGAKAKRSFAGTEGEEEVGEGGGEEAAQPVTF
jgi:hypothetical protein